MPSPNGHRAERDGCGCLPATIQCIHFAGQVLVLSPTEMPEEDCHREPCRSGGVCPSPFHVNNALDKLVDCERCGVPNRRRITKATCLPDLPAAEAEFRERERQLLEAVDA